MFETSVTVDTALLEGAAFPSPLLGVGLVLGLVGLVLAIRATPSGSRAWSLLGLIAPLLGLAIWFLLDLRAGLQTELPFACVRDVAAKAAQWIAASFTIALLSLSQLVTLLIFRSWKEDPEAFWPSLFLGAALIISGGVGWHKGSGQHEFESRVNAVMPIPALRHPEKPPEAHLNHSVPAALRAWAAGKETGWFIFRDRVELSVSERLRWGLDDLLITPTEEGVHPVPVHLQRDLISIDDQIEVRGVRDEGPRWLPLAVGNRWEFVGVRGSRDAVDKLRSFIATSSKPMPEPALVLEVTGEGERDGLHFFEITQTTNDGTVPRVRRWVRRDGELFEGETRMAFGANGGCEFELLKPSSCTCLEDRVSECSAPVGLLEQLKPIGLIVELFARFVLRPGVAVVTLGASERVIEAERQLWERQRGRQREEPEEEEEEGASVVLIRWVIDGKTSSLRPRSTGR
jgi:hypothetical protein